MNRSVTVLALGATLLNSAAPALAAETKAVVGRVPVSMQPASALPSPTPRHQLPRGGTELVLSAPPRDSLEAGRERFDPLAEYLSRALGRKVVYKHPGTWGGYQSDMQRDAYDIVFDGPHFNGWRLEKLGHNVLVKIPGEFTYVALVRKDNTRIQSVRQLAGHTVCAHAPPNLGTLIMLREFDNPARQPSIVVSEGYDKIYENLLAGKCTAAMLPLKHLQKHDKEGERTRVVFRNEPMPQQAFSAGPRLSAAEQARIAEALLAPEAERALAKFREAYTLGRPLVRANNGEYATLGQYLKDQWGYY